MNFCFFVLFFVLFFLVLVVLGVVLVLLGVFFFSTGSSSALRYFYLFQNHPQEHQNQKKTKQKNKKSLFSSDPGKIMLQ